jgi:hypothetical protein
MYKIEKPIKKDNCRQKPLPACASTKSMLFDTGQDVQTWMKTT